MASQPDHRSYAVVIGVNGAGIFNTAESNAQAVAETLASPAFQFRTVTLTGSRATRSAILETLQHFQRAASPGRILVYFAGHSFTAEDNAGRYHALLQVTDGQNGKPGVIALSELLALSQAKPTAGLVFILDTALPEDHPPPDGQQPNRYSLLTGRMDNEADTYYSITGPLLIALSSAARQYAPGKPFTVDELAQHLNQHMTAAYGQNGRFDLFHMGDEGVSFSLLPPQSKTTRQALRFPPPPGTLRKGQSQHQKPSQLSQWMEALAERVGLPSLVSSSIIAGMFITAVLIAAGVFIGRYTLQFAIVPRTTPTPISTPPVILGPFPSPTPASPATFSTPFPPFGDYVGESGYRLVTIQQVGDIPLGEPVRISSTWFDYTNNEWMYSLVSQNEQLTAEAHVWQIAQMDNYNAPTPTAKFLPPQLRGGYIVVTLEQVGSIPAGADVRVSSAWYDPAIGWTYTIVTEDGVTTAEAHDHQLMWKPGVDPYAPTPTSRFLNHPIGSYLLTTEQVGDIPAGTQVLISHAWYEEETGWVYGIYMNTGVSAEAREYQLMFMPIATPGINPSPTPSAIHTPKPNAIGTPTPSLTVTSTNTPTDYRTATPSPTSSPIDPT